MPKSQRKPGKFWPQVRALIWEKAQELYQMEQAKNMGKDFKGITATRKELREGGYFYLAKLIVLRNLWRERKGFPMLEEEEAQVFQEQTTTKNSLLPFKNPKPSNNKRKGGRKENA
ncbi:MAG: hypothetical protein K6T73_08235 [Candidatus Bathyarchaeota archaeon]|nr:hypothetical protein [Candidatus Bathyarchaeota archaeon]